MLMLTVLLNQLNRKTNFLILKIFLYDFDSFFFLNFFYYNFHFSIQVFIRERIISFEFHDSLR